MNTTEIISKVTITLSESTRIKISILLVELSKLLVYFILRSVKFQYVKETHDINSLLTLLKIVLASQQPNQTNLCRQNLLTIENTDSDLKVHALHYANELLVHIRLAFQKLLQTRQISRNYQNRSWLLLSIVWETHKLTRYQPGVKSSLT